MDNIQCVTWLRPLLIALLFSICLQGVAQQTRGVLYLRVLSPEGTPLQGASAELRDSEGAYRYVKIAGQDGSLRFEQVMPGRAYRLSVTHTGYRSFSVDSIGLGLVSSEVNGQNLPREIRLTKIEDEMPLVNVRGKESFSFTGMGSNAFFDDDAIERLPSLSRNFHDYLRLVPQVRVTGDGAMSFAGQNSRFNALFIDGASAIDILGLASNGTNGGQTGAAPISVEAIEGIHVKMNPQDPQFGNFTGGSIQAVTRSGTNRTKAAAWVYYRNERLTGRSPVELPVPGSPGESNRPRLSEFNNRTFGAWSSGPVVRDKLFYFFLFELQRESRPQAFDPASYVGSSKEADLETLATYMKTNFGYDPGSYSETEDNLDAARLNLKMDWNQSVRNKFSFSYRFLQAVRTSPRVTSGARVVAYSNLAFKLPATTHSFSTEWNHTLKNSISNRMLFSFSHQLDDRTWKGQAFPRINISDGNGTISLGADAASSFSRFEATEFFLSDVFTRTIGSHALKFGMDAGISNLKDVFASSNFGQYNFRSLAEFLSNGFPSRYTRAYSIIDQPNGDRTSAGARFRTLRGAFFLQDEFRITDRFLISAGLRVDLNAWPTQPPADPFFNDTAIQVISRFHELKGAKSGASFRTQWSLSPRLGMNWRLSSRALVSAGTGILSGHVVNVWGSDLYTKGISSLNIQPVFYNLRFIPDPYGQPTHASLGIDPGNARGDLELVVPRFRFPRVWRSSFSLSYAPTSILNIMLEGMYSLNLVETRFKQVNILPSVGFSPDPGSRTIYTPGVFPARIPLRADGSNPYTNIMLMDNNAGQKGYAWNLALSVSGRAKWISIDASYALGETFVLQEITGTNTPAFSQWSSVETVNGRNDMGISRSDNSIRHRLIGAVSMSFPISGKWEKTLVSLVYEGQSGAPFSYTINQSMINDNGLENNDFDLAYIPTRTDLALMNFQEYKIGQMMYTPEMQRNLLDAYINGNAYLRERRGGFAERNGVRMPPGHLLDLRIRQDFFIRKKERTWRVGLTADISNLLNLFNYRWGWTYFVSNGNTPLYRFQGFQGNDISRPVYRFIPLPDKPYSLQPSTVPISSARWSCQLGIRFSFE